MKRILSWVLAIGMLLGLTACGKAEANSTGGTFSGADTQGAGTAMGRWVETPIELEAGTNAVSFRAPVTMEDGSLCLYGVENWRAENQEDAKLCRFTSTDNGASWKKETLDWEQQTGGSVVQVDSLADGTSFLVAYVSQDGGDAQATGWLKKAGSDTLTQVAPPQGMNSDFGMYLLLDDHTLAATATVQSTPTGAEDSTDAMYEPKTFLLDLDTGAMTDLSDTPVNGELYGAMLDDSQDTPRAAFVYYQESGPALMAVDATGKIETLLDALPAGVSGSTMDAEGNFYCAATDGIYRLAKGGSLLEQVMPSTGFQIGISSNYCQWLMKTADGDFIAALMDDNDQGVSLYRYHWDETLPAQSENGLTV